MLMMNNSVRLQLRNWNASNVTELDETLKALPIRRQSDTVDSHLATPSEAPVNGRTIRDLNRKILEASWDEV